MLAHKHTSVCSIISCTRMLGGGGGHRRGGGTTRVAFKFKCYCSESCRLLPKGASTGREWEVSDRYQISSLKSPLTQTSTDQHQDQ